jgi:hypothetical protein
MAGRRQRCPLWPIEISRGISLLKSREGWHAGLRDLRNLRPRPQPRGLGTRCRQLRRRRRVFISQIAATETARKEGCHFIAHLFEETAENEKQHAKDHLTMLNGIGNSLSGLSAAMGREGNEIKRFIPRFCHTGRIRRGNRGSQPAGSVIESGQR